MACPDEIKTYDRLDGPGQLVRFWFGVYYPTGEIDPKTKRPKLAPAFQWWFVIPENDGTTWLWSRHKLPDDCPGEAKPYNKLYNVTGETLQQIYLKCKDRDYYDYERYEQRSKRHVGPKIAVTTNWSSKYDGCLIMAVLEDHPKMTINEVIEVVKNEGGYVENMIIHRGHAHDKIWNVRDGKIMKSLTD